jgi:hypothetical protein
MSEPVKIRTNDPVVRPDARRPAGPFPLSGAQRVTQWAAAVLVVAVALLLIALGVIGVIWAARAAL